MAWMDVIRSEGASKGTTVTDFLLNVGDDITSGMELTGRTSPTVRAACLLAWMNWSIYIRSLAMKIQCLCWISLIGSIKIELINHLKIRLKGQFISGVSQ